MAHGYLEIVYSGERDGKFLLYCMSEVEEGRYIVFTLEPHTLLEPFVEPDRETALQSIKKFFLDAQ